MIRKFQFACMSAAVMMLLAPLSAHAVPTIAQDGRSYTDADWVDGTDLLQVYDERGYHLENLDGIRLTEDGYQSFFYSSGYVKAVLPQDPINHTGLFNASGQSIIACSYGEIELKDGRWAIAFVYKTGDAQDYDYEDWFADDDAKRYLQIETADIYYLSGTEASLAASLTRDQYADSCAWGQYLAVENRQDGAVTLYDSGWNVIKDNLSSAYEDPEVSSGPYDIFIENGVEGVRDALGNMVYAPEGAWIWDIRHGLINIYKDAAQGLMDLTGSMIVPLEADWVLTNYCSPSVDEPDDVTTPYAAGGYVAAQKDGRFGFYDLSGNLTLPFTYETDAAEIYGASAVLKASDGSVHLLAADGTDTLLDEAHRELTPLDYSNGYLYLFRTEDYKYGLLDWHGNELLPAAYTSIRLSGDGLYLLAGEDYATRTLYTVTYEERIASDTEGLISEDGSSVVLFQSEAPADETEMDMVTSDDLPGDLPADPEPDEQEILDEGAEIIDVDEDII